MWLAGQKETKKLPSSSSSRVARKSTEEVRRGVVEAEGRAERDKRRERRLDENVGGGDASVRRGVENPLRNDGRGLKGASGTAGGCGNGMDSIPRKTVRFSRR